MADVFRARTIVVLADCHIHPARGIDWPRSVLGGFAGTDLFVTLGDMGERAGLDALGKLAPVIGVRGRDDEDDPRTCAPPRMLQVGKLRLGCVFDPVEAGVAMRPGPFVCSPVEELARLFGEAPDAVLWASTHAPALERREGRLFVNPGSVTLPTQGSSASFARLTLTDGGIEAEIVAISDRRS